MRHQVTSVVVNGEPVKAKGIAGILFNEDGSINMDAEIEGQDGNVRYLTEVIPMRLS